VADSAAVFSAANATRLQGISRLAKVSAAIVLFIVLSSSEGYKTLEEQDGKRC
jgi:uncharacterized membrane protein